jgi:hypothetical protein
LFCFSLYRGHQFGMGGVLSNVSIPPGEAQTTTMNRR